MIRAVIFDVGGVLVRTEDREPRARLEQRLGLPAGEAERLVFNSEMGVRAQTGVISALDLWQWVQAELRLADGELVEFQREFFAGDRLDEELVHYIRRLHRHFQTAIISNAMDDLREVVTVRYPMVDAFDLIVGSAYERIMKPDAAIFERTLARLACSAHEAVFVDDFAHNVAGARAVGINAVHFQPGLDVAAALAEFGVAVPADQ